MPTPEELTRPGPVTEVQIREEVIQRLYETLVRRGDDYGSIGSNARNMLSLARSAGLDISAFTVEQQDHDADTVAYCKLMVCIKLSRLKEQPYHQDSWLDLAGYAILALANIEFNGDKR